MNEFLPSIFDERVYRLALGLEPLDAITAGRIAQPVDVTLDGSPVVGPDTPPWPEPSGASGLFALPRHRSGRFVLLHDSKVDTPVSLRLVPADRRYVPRRITFAFLDEAAGGNAPTWSRAWRPLLFPGAAYNVEQTATGIRGTVTSGGASVRWTRVEASIAGTVIGRAHGDDRGEFLLVLGPNTDVSGTGDLVSPTDVTIDVYGRNPALPQDPSDPLADLPLETAAAPGVTPDDVSNGVDLPDHYVQVASLIDHPVILGRLSSLPIAV
jgi:hypothetical protein